MNPVEIVFKDYLLKFGLIPFVLTVSVVLLIIVITIILVIKEIRRRVYEKY